MNRILTLRPTSHVLRPTVYIRLIVLFFLLLSGCQRPPLHRDTRVLMGTFVEVTSTDARAAGIVFAELDRLDKLLSKYLPDSAISRLNAAGSLKVSPEIFDLIKKCKNFSAASEGAFDITVGPLMDAWGFSDKKYRVPPQEEIGRVLMLVGSDKIVLDEYNNTVTFSLPGMKCDLGGAAKGYALDRAAQKLKQAGMQDCLINAGGQVHCLGKERGRPWKVAIKKPRSRGIMKVLEIEGERSVATSGDYEQYFTVEGRRYSHIIDPRTGYPAQNAASVTIIADSGLTADMLATALCVLNDRQGRELLNKYPDAAILSGNTI